MKRTIQLVRFQQGKYLNQLKQGQPHLFQHFSEGFRISLLKVLGLILEIFLNDLILNSLLPQRNISFFSIRTENK